jgi:hypothetical protein
MTHRGCCLLPDVGASLAGIEESTKGTEIHAAGNGDCYIKSSLRQQSSPPYIKWLHQPAEELSFT